MGIFARLGTLIKSNINDLISRAEDPEKMLNQVLLEMQQQLMAAKKSVAVAIADEKKLKKQHLSEVDKAKEWERKAMVAVRAGDDSLARQALVRKQEHENIATQYQQQWVLQKSAVEKLKDALRLLANKIEEAKRKKNILIARQKRAQAQAQIASTLQGLGDNSAFDTFERMEDRINMLEAEAEAGAELAGEMSGDNLEAKFLQLEAADGVGAEEDLLELKAKMGLLSAGNDEDTKQLNPAPASSLSADDLKELEDLDLSGIDFDEPSADEDAEKKPASPVGGAMPAPDSADADGAAEAMKKG